MAKEFSFAKGFTSLPIKKSKQVRNEIMKALNLTSRQSWYDRLHGRSEPKISDYNAVTEILNKHGITDIWGE